LSGAWCDELSFGFGWTEPGFLERTSHALALGGRVYLFDPLEADGVDYRLAALGRPAAVVQLLGRHRRDCAAFAARLGVPHLRMPHGGLPFDVIPLSRNRFWTEVAVWAASERILLVADALGTAPYFVVRGERLAVHPLLRLHLPSALRDVVTLTPNHVLCGHGAGIHGGEAALALQEALWTARSRIPRYLTGRLRGRR
jgi:hypothetical protein